MTRTLFPLSNLAALAVCVAVLVNLTAPGLTRAAVCGDVNGDGVLRISVTRSTALLVLEQ